MNDGIRIYQYTPSGQLSKVLDEFGEIDDDFIYPNTSTNNPSQEVSYHTDGSVRQRITYTYDDKLNVFKELNMRFWDILDTEAVIFADNNTTSILDEEFDTQGNLQYVFNAVINYTYDDQDRPVQADYIDQSDGALLQRFTFFYDDCEGAPIDSDGDGVPDSQELPICVGPTDCDGDGISDGGEFPGCEADPGC